MENTLNNIYAKESTIKFNQRYVQKIFNLILTIVKNSQYGKFDKNCIYFIVVFKTYGLMPVLNKVNKDNSQRTNSLVQRGKVRLEYEWKY